MAILQLCHLSPNFGAQSYDRSDTQSTTQTVRQLALYCTDSYATITTASYLGLGLNGITIRSNDLIYAMYGATSNLIGVFVASLSGTVVTLTPFHNANDLVTFDITVGQASLASAGSVALITAATTTAQYKIRGLWINSGGTAFSGGGGDRLGQITDGTTVYSVIPAANLQTLTNNGWGLSTPLPYPVSAAINTSTVAGANVSFKYSAGSADYTAGSIVVSGTYQRVA